MAAGTANAAEVLLDTERGWMQPALRQLTEHDLIACGIEFCFAQKFTIPTTAIDDANDFTRLVQVPAGAYIWDFRATPSDMDTGAAALVYDLLVAEETSAGSWTTRVTLVSGSTNGQAAAGSDRIANAAVGRFVGKNANYWIVFKTTTAAATPAAGTLKCAWKFSIGAINRAKRGIYLLDAEA